MDQEVASKKILLTCLIGSSIFLLVLALTYQFRSDFLHVCNRDNKLTVMLQISPDKQVLFYPDDTEAVIECLTLNMPFYDRTIEMVINQSISTVVIKDIEQRYRIGKVITRGEVMGESLWIKVSSVSSLISTASNTYQVTKRYDDTKFTNGYSIVLDPRSLRVPPKPTVKIITSVIDLEKKIVQGLEYMQNGKSTSFKLN